MGDSANEKRVRTICKECKQRCSIQVRVKDGRAVAIEPAPDLANAEDKLCWKTQAGLERLYHPDRLHKPLKRVGERGQGKWQPISWEEALDTISNRLMTYKTRHGAETVAFIKGHYDRR